MTTDYEKDLKSKFKRFMQNEMAFRLAMLDYDIDKLEEIPSYNIIYEVWYKQECKLQPIQRSIAEFKLALNNL